MDASERFTSLMKLLEAEPDDSFLNYALALEYHKQGKIQIAIDLIEKILIRDENYLGAYLQLGQLYEEIGKVNEALTSYRKGAVFAQKQNNRKTLSELNQAILVFED